MKAGWRNETLDGIFEIGSSKRVLQKQWQNEGVPFYRAREIVKLAKQGSVENDLFISEEHFEELKEKHGVPSAGDLMVSAVGTLGACYVVQPEDRFYFKDASVLRFHPKMNVCSRFYQYAFQWDGLLDTVKKSDGATVGTLTISRAKGISVPLPPLEEQQRIVAVLDEAFEGLARARAHAEANLQNARELFDSALNEALDSGRPDWRTLTVSDTLTRTKVPAKIQRKAYLEEGAFPIVSQEAGLINGYWNEEDDVIHLKRPVVVFGDHTRALKYVDFDFVVGADGTQIMAPVECLEPRFYYYALKTIDLEGKGYARHFSHLKKCNINFPTSVEVQQSMAAWLDDLSARTQDLERQYIRTLQDLDDLRQSLLQKAFAGELI